MTTRPALAGQEMMMLQSFIEDLMQAGFNAAEVEQIHSCIRKWLKEEEQDYREAECLEVAEAIRDLRMQLVERPGDL